jgi:hypothetical protein
MQRFKSIEGIFGRLALTAAVAFLAGCAGGGGGGGDPVLVPTFNGQQAPDSRETEVSGIDYPSVAAARQALEARDDAKVSEEDGWTLIEEPDTGTVWNFTPPDHPAHPTVVKRSIIKRPGKDDIDMQGRCEGPRSACERLIRQFEYQNAQLIQSSLRLHQQPTGAAADLPPIGGLMR